MRFTEEKKLRKAYIESTRKTKHKFLWFPLTIDGETRWLETATIEYRVNWDWYPLSDCNYYYWEGFKFINE